MTEWTLSGGNIKMLNECCFVNQYLRRQFAQQWMIVDVRKTTENAIDKTTVNSNGLIHSSNRTGQISLKAMTSQNLKNYLYVCQRLRSDLCLISMATTNTITVSEKKYWNTSD